MNEIFKEQQDFIKEISDTVAKLRKQGWKGKLECEVEKGNYTINYMADL